MDRYLHSLMVELYIGRYLHNLIFRLDLSKSGNKNKGKGNGVGLAWESKSHCFVNWFLITHAHSFGTDTPTWRFHPLTISSNYCIRAYLAYLFCFRFCILYNKEKQSGVCTWCQEHTAQCTLRDLIGH